jgi:S-DNA-T family DNA segregation ATPase FtsK/SpoIIIE
VVAVSPGPVITTFEYEPAPGVKINKIVNLTDDLALALRATSIRIVAPIPGKAVIGIELPNTTRELVRFKGIVASSTFEKSKSKLTICLGKDIIGNPVVAELDKMPHLLIAGATGTGKSVALNSMICSLLYKSTPDEVKLIMIDPKRIELSSYDGIPHLITPVVIDVKKATNALFWAVREMERRYELLSEKKSRNLRQYNQKIEKEKGSDKDQPSEKLPYIVIVIDELADLMLAASRNVEIALTRLAQMARAAGIHLILATQRPSVDVLTGIIKANFPTRLTFQVSSKTDSRTIIDTNGAENLLGEGDMLFLPPGTAKLQRIHGAFISEEELIRIIGFLKSQETPEYDQTILKEPPKEEESDSIEYDERYDDAVALITKTGQASISMIQRHLRIGYNRAARIIEVMEKEGIVGPSDGAKPREVLVKGYEDIP